MKKALIILAFLSCVFYSNAQTLFGTTFYGGNDGGGTINQFIPATNDVTVAISFENFAANPYYTNLIEASNGKFYGMTSNGGKNGNGIIFSFDPSSATYLKLKDFDNSNGDGQQPTGSLLQAKDGLLYGMTSFGGVYSVGVIFSYDPVANTYVKLYDFDNSNGANPQGSLIQGTDGKLYGMANGGDNGYGIIFSFDPSSLSFKLLYECDYVNGAFPQGSLTQATNGQLYGMTNNGGSNSLGVIFSFDPITSVYSKLRDFDTTGGYPYGDLIQAKDGKLYGMTFGGYGGYGFIFSFNPENTQFSILKNFDGTNGGNPYGSLIQNDDGKLYGMTSSGGILNNGVIFSFDPANSLYNELKDLDNTSGSGPYGSLAKASNGNLYGMTFQGGVSNDGVIFSINTSNNTYTKLKDFATNITGRNCSASLLKATDNKLYGMTSLGGKTNDGVIFYFDPTTFTYTKLKDFDSTEGTNPYGSLIQASDGKLYGMTSEGGNNGSGVIFSFDPVTLIYSKLKDFNDTNGANPYGSLFEASNGILYGMTYGGGRNGYGVIFSYDPSTGNYQQSDFYNSNGANPYGNFIQAADGKLYAITFGGGRGYIVHDHRTGAGVLFSCDLALSVFTKIKDFDYYDDGGFPYGSLIQANDGKLYGVNSLGGSIGDGVIFSYDPSAMKYTKINDFDIDNGGRSYGNLIQASDKKIYGMTHDGGANTNGVIFSYDNANSIFTKRADYNINNGAYPYYGSAFVEVPEQGVLAITSIDLTGKNIQGVNQLSWTILGVEQTDFYNMQRSSNAQNFTNIAHLQALGSNVYKYNDKMFNASLTYYYRLKSIDKFGKISYSNIVKIDAQIKSDFALVNPNPFKESLMVTVTTSSQESAMFILTDVTGKRLFQETKQLYKGANVSRIDETKRLAKGTYLLTIITPSQLQTIKVVKDN